MPSRQCRLAGGHVSSPELIAASSRRIETATRLPSGHRPSHPPRSWRDRPTPRGLLASDSPSYTQIIEAGTAELGRHNNRDHREEKGTSRTPPPGPRYAPPWSRAQGSLPVTPIQQRPAASQLGMTRQHARHTCCGSGGWPGNAGSRLTSGFTGRNTSPHWACTFPSPRSWPRWVSRSAVVRTYQRASRSAT